MHPYATYTKILFKYNNASILKGLVQGHKITQTKLLKPEET